VKIVFYRLNGKCHLGEYRMRNIAGCLVVNFLFVVTSGTFLCAEEGSDVFETVNINKCFNLGAGHIEQMIDDKGRSYFDVFLTDPPEAVFDWPDFVDLPARYWEASAMIKNATGRDIAKADKIRKRLFSFIKKMAWPIVLIVRYLNMLRNFLTRVYCYIH